MSCSHHHGTFSHLRGPCRRKRPIPRARVEISLLFEGCMRHSTLWQLLQEKNLQFSTDIPEEVIVTEANPPPPGDDTEEEKKEEVTEEEEKIKANEEDEKMKGIESKYEKMSINDVISQMVVMQPTTQSDIRAKLSNCQAVLKDDLASIERVARELCHDAADNGLRYVEVGLDPSKFITEGQGISKEEVVTAVLRGFRGAEENGATKGGLIIQVERGKTGDTAELLDLCDPTKHSNVLGLELTCGDTELTPVVTAEGGTVDSLLFSTEDIALMEEAKSRKIHRSVQAGEFGPHDMIFQALEKLSADRIVFGYSVTSDPNLYQDCIKNKIHFAVCPSLSILNSAVSLSTFYHPLVQFAEEGVSYSINTGLPIITGGWTVQEFELVRSWGLTETMLSEATFNAARASFLSDQDKKDLLRELRKAYGMEDKVELEIFINHKCGIPDDPRKILKTSF